MDRPSTSRPQRSATGAGRRGGVGHSTGPARHGPLPALFQAAPLRAEELDVLRDWLAGSAALRPDEARRLLDRALERRQLVDEPALHWRAVKAGIAGDANWAPMGFRLTLD